MSVFGAYSRYYNLLYKDKDYAAEAEYVHGLIQKHCPGAQSILDLGCGTGRHDALLTEKGYEVTGVDMSEEMLAEARSQADKIETKIKADKVETKIEIKENPESQSQSQSASRPSYHLGDIRTIRLNRTFDVVVSLFHVMSYQTTNDDLQAAFATAKAHLKPGGVFIFDCWYGPAVLTDRPVVRVKRLEDGEIAVTRVVEPVMHPNDNLVDLHYEVLVRDKASGEVEAIEEIHRMRYLFRPEIELLLRKAGMCVFYSTEWMSDQQPGLDTWAVCFMAKINER